MQPLTIFGMSVEAFITVATGVIVALVAVVGVAVTRRRDVSANAKAVFGDALAIQKLVDEAVKKAVAEAVAPWARRMKRVESLIRIERAARRTLRSVFLAYVGRVQTGGSSDLTEDERLALDVEPDEIPELDDDFEDELETT